MIYHWMYFTIWFHVFQSWLNNIFLGQTLHEEDCSKLSEGWCMTRRSFPIVWRLIIWCAELGCCSEHSPLSVPLMINGDRDLPLLPLLLPAQWMNDRNLSTRASAAALFTRQKISNHTLSKEDNSHSSLKVPWPSSIHCSNKSITAKQLIFVIDDCFKIAHVN